MRTITTHKVNGCNEAIAVEVLDEPGVGGACHQYLLSWPGALAPAALNFQNGPVPAVGTNGITHESLLAVLIDRLKGFQSGNYACMENASALWHLERALAELHTRTLKRTARGVEGTHAV
jgi:hypothetical protein